MIEIKRCLRHSTSRRPIRPSRVRVSKAQWSDKAVSNVEGLIKWCRDNGVVGVDVETRKISIVDDGSNDRGMTAVREIVRSDDLLIVPLRMAIAVHSQEDCQLTYPNAKWSVRLACKLLREKAMGTQSPWYDYIKSLPEKIPSPLSSFTRKDERSIEYGGIKDRLNDHRRLISDAWKQLKGEAHGNASKKDFVWAMSVVYSRTVGTTGRGGSIEVQMLLPYADMFNHGGDRYGVEDRDGAMAMDDVSWMIHPPTRSTTGEWEMKVYAIRDVGKGDQVLLSYGEGSNDDFFLHYGFVPPLNPRDDYFLFSHLEEAVEWYRNRYCSQVDPNIFQEKKTEALHDVMEVDPSLQSAAEEDGHAEVDPAAEKLWIMSGGFTDERLTRTFQKLQDLTSIPVRSVVEDRCRELLDGKTDLLEDLTWLANNAGDDPHGFSNLLSVYRKSIAAYEEAGGKLPTTIDRMSDSASYARTLIKTYDAYKKMILWDVLLGYGRTKPPPSPADRIKEYASIKDADGDPDGRMFKAS